MHNDQIGLCFTTMNLLTFEFEIDKIMILDGAQKVALKYIVSFLYNYKIYVVYCILFLWNFAQAHISWSAVVGSNTIRAQ